jgi:uncharacterized protein (TIGR02391 family)
MPLPWPTAEDAWNMPVEQLALRVLERLIASDQRTQGSFPLRSGTIRSWVHDWDRADGSTRSASEAAQARPQLLDALAEAWEWLRANGFLAPAVGASNQLSPDAFIVTRRGREILDYLEPLDMIRAQRRLGVELHPKLAGPLRPLVQAGAFEQAAFDALRQVEVRVREMAGTKEAERRVTVGLMRYAFGEDGPLGLLIVDPGERDGLSHLFAGAFGAVRNPLGHRTVQWDDATEAAEMVLLADLLMRQLDHLEPALEFQREIAREQELE